MKKMMFLFAVLLICLFAVPVTAQVTLDPTASDYEITIFSSLVNDGTKAVDPQTVEVLYDLNGNPSFLIADIIPHGFAIMFREAHEISEQAATEDTVNPYLTAMGQKVYAGPMSYIDFYNGVYTNLLFELELSDNAIQHMSLTTENVLTHLPEPSHIQAFSIPFEHRITHQDFVKQAGFGRNTNNTCGQIAAAILLVYYERLERVNGRPNNRVVPAIFISG